MPISDDSEITPSGSLLSNKEIKTPELVLEKLFQYAHLPEIVKTLEEIKGWLLNKNYPYSFGTREHINILYFFERLLSLVNAAWVIEQQRQKEENEVIGMIARSSSTLFHQLFDKVDALYNASSYLHDKGQNNLSSYLLHKAVFCAYNALIATATDTIDETSNLEELAKICSKVFRGLPNPFTSQTPEAKYLKLLNSVTLSKAFNPDFTIEEDIIKYLLKEVNIIRRDICNYYESKAEDLNKSL